MNRRLTRISLAATLAIAGCLAASSSAGADHHLMQIRQIHPSLGPSGGEWV